MTKIIVDDKAYEVPAGNNLLHACLSLGLDLPYFCWHPCLGSVGACRQCAVKQYQDENDSRGRIVMACMTPASEGARISVADPQARDFRAGIIELLMTNHPHDCPVCEEGGECHLQDMTEMSGHTFRRYEQTKRTHRNQYLGPFINHEMNRCIACYRCVRYYQDYAGGSDLQMLGAHHHVYFGRHCDGTLENPFSGNLVEVCPTGVFTDKTFSQDYTRKWDLQCAPSICQHCAVGCNTSPGERYGRLKRIVNRYHNDVNGYFLCDRGRFGYGFVNGDQRLHQVMRRQGGSEETTGQAAQVATAAAGHRALAELLARSDSAVIGSPRTSLENNFALLTAARQHFCGGFSAAEQQIMQTAVTNYRQPDIGIPSPADIETADAILILGEDILNTAPVLALRVRQAVRNRARDLAAAAGIPAWQDAAVQELAQQSRNPLIQLTVDNTDLDAIAAINRQLAPADIARLGFAIAHGINSEAPAPNDLTAAETELADRVCALLNHANRPLVITGTALLSTAVLEAAANIAKSLSRKLDAPCPLHQCLAECNSLGAAMLAADSATLEQTLEGVEDGAIKRLLVLENDLYRRCDSRRLDAALDRLDELIVIDHQWTATAAKADWVLPAATFAESEGTLVNSEARAQRFFAVFPGVADVRAGWQWLTAANPGAWAAIDAVTADRASAETVAVEQVATEKATVGKVAVGKVAVGKVAAGNVTIDAVTKACAASQPLLAQIVAAAPPAEARSQGRQVPRMPHRYSGRTAIRAHINVSEPKQTPDPMSALGFTMEGDPTHLPPALRPSTWAPGWNSNQSIHKFQQEVNGELAGGPSGVRLLDEPAAAAAATWFTEIPPAFRAAGDKLQPVPLYHIFGSEELSQRAEPIQARRPRDYIALHPDDAARLQVCSSDGISFSAAGLEFCLGVRITAALPAGVIGLPMGIGGLTPAALATPLTVTKAFDWQPPPSPGDRAVIASDLAANGGAAP
ncbi:NADH-quinone oxidoreductase subunit NuoG [Exilibacterium tricleocarpae]|uniref:NADH-quinone oxidoreductase n=1 Tax=Exilibacterium tricleocarpae TaxID=2591008 RepID=A0A545T1V0_9GAMM|nr:NADH-quinone oxidoreductase subunit NuoG [Exilibacterium tricleocarpae]TQV71183.1 NADH-quinone oxidoreductase subunit NuoG [Exilibacterium tricleocarpae]